MQKNNIKSFICSFLFSILAVFAVQKVFLRAEHSDFRQQPALNIKPQHKISLFAEKKSPETPKAPLLIAQNQTLNDTPQKVSKSPLKTPVLSSVSDSETVTFSKEKPMQEQQAPQSTFVQTDIAYAEEITFSAQEQDELKEQKRLENAGIVYADISDTFEPESFEIAQTSQNDEIPLIENNIAVHSQINLQNAASASQIAMIEPNTIINGLQETDILTEEKNLAEADIKKSELGQRTNLSETDQEIDETAWAVATAATEDSLNIQDAENTSFDSEDSPWVIAKGNKYAKNQAAVEAYSSLPLPTERADEPSVKQDEPQNENAVDYPSEKEDESQNESTVDYSTEKEGEIQTDDISNTVSDAESETEDENSLKNNLDDTTENRDEVDTEQTSENDMSVPTEQSVIEQTFNEPLLKQKENNSKLAYEMIQNILIPIPDSILNDADIIPDLTASPDGSSQKPQHTYTPKPNLNEKEKQSGLFKSISSWFNKNKNDTNTTVLSGSSENKNQEKTGTFQNLKDKVYSALGSVEDYKNLNDVSIMPAELRLSFAPNRAEISGQTLKWIYAFADNARDHNDVYVEVRIDGTSSYALQQKRLNLLSSIFASRGVDYRKINTVFTSREPNSFIIRNIRFNNNRKGETNE